MAFWLSDDGQYVKNGGVTLCTDNFSTSEVFLLKYLLEDKYQLSCTIDNRNLEKAHIRIYISAKSLPILRELVAKSMHSSMVYKINR